MRVDADDYGRPCSCGREHQIDVREIVIESGAVQELETEMSDGFLKEYISPLLICDTNTNAATEEIMEEIYDRCQVLVLDADELSADNYAIDVLENNMDEDIDLILAVGSGTIHDISRYMAYKYKVPFVSVPTAASMDGFAANVAAMTWAGLNKTIPAVAPLAIFADTDIITAAPARLNAAGVSDILAKYICLIDWKISYMLTGEYYCAQIVEIQERAIKLVKSSLRAVADLDEDGCEKLIEALILSGIAVQLVGNSRPASGAEHQLAHLWDMQVINGPLSAYHGETVSVAALCVLREYKRIARAIEDGRCSVKETYETERSLWEEYFGKNGLLDLILEENTPDPLKEISRETLEDCLQDIAEMIEELPDEETMIHMMEKAGCVYEPEELGLSDEIVPLSLQLAPYTRKRLSLLRISKMLEIREE